MALPTTRTEGEHRVFEFWLVLDFSGQARIVKTQPACDRNERAMFIVARLPLSLWRTPSLSARIEFPEGTSPMEMRIDAEAAAEAVRGAIGCDIDIVIRRPE